MKTIIHRFFLTDHLFNSKLTDSTPEVIKQALANGKLVKMIKGSILLMGVIFAIVSSLFVTSCTPPQKDEFTNDKSITQLSKEALIEKGKYLTTTSACHDCHSPKILTPGGVIVDTTRILSGHRKESPVPAFTPTNDWIMFNNEFTAYVGPWGVTFAANLTPHDTGTGSWSFEQFKTAIRKGKYKGLEGSRPLLPPMPWEMYKNFTDEDLLAIFTYLQSIKPIDNLVPYPIGPSDMALNN